jgi:hypothetical protein
MADNQTQTGKRSPIAILEKIEAVLGRLPSSVRAERIFKLIDSDDSGLISRRELEQLMVQGGSSPASASMSAEKLFSQANMGTMKQVSMEQFSHLIETERVTHRDSFFFFFFLMDMCIDGIYIHLLSFSSPHTFEFRK